MAFQSVSIGEREPELKLFDKFLSTYDKSLCLLRLKELRRVSLSVVQRLRECIKTFSLRNN